jgi:acyl-CoA synthetase (AMP-forming)/AMP-acid ligase II
MSPRDLTVHPAIVEALSGDTLVDCLLSRAERPEQVAFWLEGLDAPDGEPVEVDAGRLLESAGRAARGLRRLGLEPGERIMLVLPTSLDFVFLLWGILLARGTPAPAYPPAGLGQLAAFSRNLLRMIEVARARFVVVPELLRGILTENGATRLGQAVLVTPEEIWAAAGSDGDAATTAAAVAPEELALIQFSSGSTGDPRGVCLSHGNILANVRAFATRIAAQPDDVCVTWLPLYHDMGLIGTLMATLMARVALVLFPPTDFLRKPAFWLQMLGKYRATIGVAPQFAYNLCVRKAPARAQAGVDLSCLRVLLNGAEPIHREGIEAFEEAYRPLGLRAGVVTPCYGLAEGTLAACMAVPGRAIAAARGESAEEGGESGERPVVSCGPPMDATEVRILGSDGTWLPEGAIGEICVRGPSVCRGILGADGIVPATNADGWLATRDLGFLRGGELYVTGRLKDLIIIGGRNIYPQDLEAVAAELPGFRPGRIAAFGVTEPGRATEVVVVVAEYTEAPDAAVHSVSELRRRLLERFGVIPHDTVLLGRGQIPVTTSGKIRRAQTRIEYERGAFSDVVYRVRPASPSPASPSSLR